MGKIKVFTHVSLDGFVSRNDGDIDWMLPFLKGNDYGYNSFRESLGGVILSDVHYTTLQSYGFKWQYGDLPCCVITQNPARYVKNQSPNLHFIAIDNGAKLAEDKRIAGLLSGDKDIWLAGDRELVSRFMGVGLIDEVTLVILPITLGSGRPLAGGYGSENLWELAGVQKYDNGAVRIDYRRRSE